MSRTHLTIIASLVISSPVFSAQIVTETRDGNTVVNRTHTYANSAGDLRIDEQGMDASSSTSEASTSGKTTTEYTPGRISDTTLYQSKGKAIVSMEGRTCRRMTADSAPPPGMPTGMDMKQMQSQMADAMSTASKAMEDAMRQARKEGMTKEQEAAMKQYTQPFMNAPKQEKQKMMVEKLNNTITVAGYKGEGYKITDERGEKHQVWVTQARKIPGALDVRKGMENMYNVYAQYLDKMGGADLMDRGMFSVFMEGQFANMYPIRTKDLSNGEITDIIEARSNGTSVEYYPDCEVRDMFGQ